MCVCACVSVGVCVFIAYLPSVTFALPLVKPFKVYFVGLLSKHNLLTDASVFPGFAMLDIEIVRDWFGVVRCGHFQEGRERRKATQLRLAMER